MPTTGESRFSFRAVVLALPPLTAAVALAADDTRDQPYITVLVNRALETERTQVEIPWSNPETGHRGVIVVERTFYRGPDTTPCREYRRTLEQPGQSPATVRGTGCRIGAGLWKLDEEGAPPAASATTPGQAEKAPLALPKDLTKPPTPAKAPASEAKTSSAPPTSSPAPAAGPSAPPEPAARTPASKPPALPAYTLPSKADL